MFLSRHWISTIFRRVDIICAIGTVFWNKFKSGFLCGIYHSFFKGQGLGCFLLECDRVEFDALFKMDILLDVLEDFVARLGITLTDEE